MRSGYEWMRPKGVLKQCTIMEVWVSGMYKRCCINAYCAECSRAINLMALPYGLSAVFKVCIIRKDAIYTIMEVRVLYANAGMYERCGIKIGTQLSFV